jgi:N-dimethylarginine dimethylaminohydrolase
VDFAVDDAAAWGYSAPPDLAAARVEHAGLVAVLEAAGVRVEVHDGALPGLADSIFVYDPTLMTDHGVIVLQLGKASRRGEEPALGRRLEELGVPILGRLTGDATADGGDLLWLETDHLVAGRSFRTNAEGVRRLRLLLEPIGVEVSEAHLPVHSGSRHCLHLLSLISLLDRDLAVAYPGLFPVPLWQELRHRGVEFVEVPDEEFATQGSNVLALGPRHVLVLEGSPVTRKRLEAAGCRVESYRGDEISHKAEGGPTCLTLPVLRDRGPAPSETRP